MTDLTDRYAQTDKEIYEEARDFLSLCEDAESDNRKRGLEAKKFRDGEQWPETLYKEREVDGRLSLTINYTDLYVERIENQLKQQRPRIKCHPVKDSTAELAEVVNGLVRHIENRSQASVAYDAAASSALDIGWGYARLISEYVDERSFDQELRIVPILNTFTVYRDPDSVLPDGSDSMRYLISYKMPRKAFKLRYPGVELSDFSAGASGDDLDWEGLENIRLAEYFRIVEKPERLFKMANGSTRLESDFEKGVLKNALAKPEKHGFAVEEGKAVERPSTKRQVQWFKLTGTKVIDRRDLPGRYIPIVACQGKVLDIEGKRSRKGMIANLMEPARMVNYWETMKTERLALAPKAEWVAYEGVIDGHNEWHDANRKSYSVLVGKAVLDPTGTSVLPLPIKTQPAGVEQGMSEAMQSAYSGLMAMAGQPHDPGQDARGEVVSGVALAERRELADISHFQYYDNQMLMIDFMGRLILDWIPVTYSTQRMQRIISEDGKPQMVSINERDPAVDQLKNDLTVGQYAVVMDTGPGYDTKRREGADTLIGILKTPLGEIVAQKGPDLALRALDTAYSEQLADRLATQIPEELKKIVQGLPEQARTVITQLQGQVQQLTAKVQEQEMDLKHGLTKALHQEATKLQVEDMRDKRAEADTRTDATVKLHDTEVNYHKAINVAEINAGAKLIDSNQDRAHEKELAKTIAAAAEKAEKSNGKAN